MPNGMPKTGEMSGQAIDNSMVAGTKARAGRRPRHAAYEIDFPVTLNRPADVTHPRVLPDRLITPSVAAISLDLLPPAFLPMRTRRRRSNCNGKGGEWRRRI